MFRSVAINALVLVFAVVILLISVFSVGSPTYVFSQSSNLDGEAIVPDAQEQVDVIYELPYPGRVSPDHPLWPVKALRDKLTLIFTFALDKKSELNLLYADKRLIASKDLFEKDKPELGFTTLTKSQMYLETAYNLDKENREMGDKDTQLLRSIANASLKHRQVIEEIIAISPEDAKPKIVEVMDVSKMIYDDTKIALMSVGIDPPKSPFEGN